MYSRVSSSSVMFLSVDLVVFFLVLFWTEVVFFDIRGFLRQQNDIRSCQMEPFPLRKGHLGSVFPFLFKQ